MYVYGSGLFIAIMSNVVTPEHYTDVDRTEFHSGESEGSESGESLNRVFFFQSFIFFYFSTEGKSLACAHDCKFIETSSGIQHNVDELLVGSLKQCRLRDEKLRKDIKTNKSKNKLHSSRTSLSLHLAKEILGKLCLQNSKSKSCENLHVL